MSDKKYIRLPIDLFSSISRFIHSSDYFPTLDRRIGLSARIGYHPDYKRVMVEIEEERPSFVSTTRGEYIDIEEANAKLMQRASELADYCQEVAKELLEHAERLREVSKKGEIVNPSQLESIARDESKGGKIETNHEESRAHARSKSHTRVRPTDNPSLLDANLDLFT